MENERDLIIEGPAGKAYANQSDDNSAGFLSCVIIPDADPSIEFTVYTPVFRRGRYIPTPNSPGEPYRWKNIADKELEKLVMEILGLTINELEQRVAVHKAMIDHE